LCPLLRHARPKARSASSDVPGIHVLGANGKKVVDGRDRPGHDRERYQFL
jgi:hypothetical protein